MAVPVVLVMNNRENVDPEMIKLSEKLTNSEELQSQLFKFIIGLSFIFALFNFYKPVFMKNYVAIDGFTVIYLGLLMIATMMYFGARSSKYKVARQLVEKFLCKVFTEDDTPSTEAMRHVLLENEGRETGNHKLIKDYISNATDEKYLKSAKILAKNLID